MSAVTAVFWRQPLPLAPHMGLPSFLSLDRLDQMLRYEASLPAIRSFERHVPANADVALALRGDEHEYALFGPRLGRRLYPVAYAAPTAAPAQRCDYLLFDPALGVAPSVSDIDLGYHWRLRRLFPPSVVPLPADRVSPAGEPTVVIDGQIVQRLHAPGSIEWTMAGRERELVFGYGLVPESYERGNGNGVVFIVELRPTGSPPLILFEQWLDPVNRPADRGLKAAHVVLPAPTRGATLVLRTDPGPHGDNAWDWAYVTSPLVSSENLIGSRIR
jgi:hypothetical protein